jgi:hypothetical protein
MRIGFSGAHRTGKSTLASLVSKELSIEFFETSVSAAPVWKECHMSPGEQVTFAERVFLQQSILGYLSDKLASASGSICADRTPIDLVGYLLANVDHTCGNLQHDAVNRLIIDCVKNTILNFDHVFIIQPGIQVVEDTGKQGKTFLSKPYQMAVNNQIIATCVNYMSDAKYTIIPSNLRSNDERAKFIRKKLNK